MPPQTRDALAAGNNGPPPSTLAAQLVESISVSARSTRPDETSELSKLLGVIEKVKNQPGLLQTQQDRVDHNHMLIYVYTRVSLEGIKWDDPFADRQELCSDALGAINFLKFAIRETPEVLLTSSNDGSLLFRGQEPLWVWLFPKILKTLGSNLSSDLVEAVSDFFGELLLASCQTSALWPLIPQFLSYLQLNVQVICEHLVNLDPVATSRDVEVKLRVPTKAFLDCFAAQDHGLLETQCTFVLQRLSQAQKQAFSVLSILSLSVERLIEKKAIISVFEDMVPSLLDLYLLFHQAQSRWQHVSSNETPALLRYTVNIQKRLSKDRSEDELFQDKTHTVLVLLCADISKLSSITWDKGDANYQLLCTTLVSLAGACVQSKPLCRMVVSQLLPVLETVMLQNATASASDLRRCTDLLSRMTNDPLSTPLAAANVENEGEFADGDLRQQVKALNLGVSESTALETQSKRRKVTAESQTLPKLVSMLALLLGADDSEPRRALDNFSSSFQALDELQQSKAISILGFICCAADDTLKIDTMANGESQSPNLSCSYCDPGSDLPVPSTLDVAAKQTATRVISALIQTPAFLETRRPRITAMVALRRMAKHCRDPQFLDVETSVPAQWCIRSLQSSVRDLRIASTRTLPVFLLDTGSNVTEVAQKNCNNSISVLRSISAQNASNLAETCIMAWSQVGSVVTDDHLNLVLVKLVEYLGDSAALPSAAAMTELLRLAQSRNVSPRHLFEPFWRYIAFSALKDLATQPKLAKMLADIIGMSLSGFVLHIHAYALPWLVLTKRLDVIQEITRIRGFDEPWKLCLDNANLSQILAVLMIQECPDVQEFSMSLLRTISKHFDGLSLKDLLQMEPLLTTLELLKAAGDADDAKKTQIRNALNLLGTLIQPLGGQSRQKRSHATGRFLQFYALGLMTPLVDVINDTPQLRHPIQERKRCIKAIEEMIKVGKSHIRVARPQISACLLAAMPSDELRSVAFSCWATALSYLDEDDVEMPIETTFFLVNHYWSSFTPQTQQLARELFESLLRKERPVLEAVISKLPSFSHINELAEVEASLNQLRQPVDNRTAFSLLTERLRHENSGVVLQALGELSSYLQKQQGYLQASAVSEQPDTIVSNLLRALLDCASRYSGAAGEITSLCTQCLGQIGCLDPNRVETVRAEKQIVVRSNFENNKEVTDFVVFILEHVLVRAFLAATDTKIQGFLAFAMQELLERVDISAAVQLQGSRDGHEIYRKWLSMSESSREVLGPFLTSKYLLPPVEIQRPEYPIFKPEMPYANWLRAFCLDLLRRPQNPFSELVFEPLCRVVRTKEISTAEFMLPYLVHHVIISEHASEEVVKANVLRELLNVLKYELPSDASYMQREDRKLYCEAVFRVLDYSMRWIQVKRGQGGLNPREISAMDKVQIMLNTVPPELISKRAVECKAYSRALFHLEQHIRQVDEDKHDVNERDRLLQQLQDIYTQIDEPDGLEGISAHLHVLDINHQILSHRKAGRWGAAQTWYEIKLAENPDDADIQIDLLTCLKESGQHDVLLNYVEGMEKHATSTTINHIVPFAVEASWATNRWQTMERFITKYQGDVSENFNVSIAQALLHLQRGWTKSFVDVMKTMRSRVGSSMTFSATSSLQSSHEPMLRCHVLTDLELISGINNDETQHLQETLKTLNRRLEVLGSYVTDKQFVLGVRRAAMHLMRPKYNDLDISSLWLSSAQLARKANSMHQAFNAVLHASDLGDGSATIENARLLWKEGHSRKAIQTLQGAIASNIFVNQSFMDHDASEKNIESQQSMVAARAQLLLAKWLDSAGQTHASSLRQHYQNVPRSWGTWEKGHYYLGRHYKKVLESEKQLPLEEQSDSYLSGETAKMVVENYVRSLNFGTKYLYQTLPRVLTLWLDMAASMEKAPPGKVSLSRELYHRRKTLLDSLHKYLNKYIARMPAYIFYTALPQIVARIAHPNQEVFLLLQEIILKVVEAHPRQALWNLFAIMTSKQATTERKTRGQSILLKMRGMSKKVENGQYDLNKILRAGEKLADQLLMACNNGDFQSNRSTHASITRDLNFNHRCTPCPLVVPIETCLTATLPTLTDNVKKHKAFSRDVITIDCFLDDVLVLGSLAKPRRLTARGSNGSLYYLLIKPKDDLRTDQRLMEFNGMINRSLKRDAESSRRQLYIRTYAVTPLNEECGIIEWVDGLKTLREILLGLYKSKAIVPNYGHLAAMMKDAATSDKNIKLFTEGVLGTFPAVLPQWFVSQFPSPSQWFGARLRYTRSCAVMSMVGTILGLGDRHGENVLLEEGNGGVFHVDFNCLFDKGLTFAQPEKVPFRLTHNMVAAMGIYGYEGPFRKCSELTLGILRQQEETLMTILEAFIYDPTLDLQRDKKRKNDVVKLNPQAVVDSIRRKVRGLLAHEVMALGVEGQVEELIKQAVNPRNLAAMYIGWCPFL